MKNPFTSLSAWYKTKHWVSPFNIIRRLICIPFVYVLMVMLFVVTFIGWGPKAAIRLWQDVL
jgi:hypothetical protein